MDIPEASAVAERHLPDRWRRVPDDWWEAAFDALRSEEGSDR
jgi:hypothetical protein